MDALLAKYSTSFKVLSRYEKVTGKVAAKLPKKLVLDIGGKSEGIVAEKAFDEARDYIEKLQIGDSVEATVISPEAKDGTVLLSLKGASTSASWGKLESALEKGKEISVVCKFVNTSGVMVEVGGMQGFIPNSQLSKKALSDKEKLVGKELSAIVIEVDQKSNRFILSEKAATEGITPSLVKSATESLKEGQVHDAVVNTVSDFGAFAEIVVEIEGKSIPVEGLIHVSEMSWEKIEDPKTAIKKGDKVKVKVIGGKNNRLALSMKQAMSDPWDTIEDNYKVEQKITGKVTRMTDFGVFVQIEPGIEGLLHITKIPPDHKMKTGDEVKAIIEELDAKARKISLGLVLTQKPLLYK